MKIVLCSKVQISRSVPDGKYACISQQGQTWWTRTVKVTGEEVVEDATTMRNTGSIPERIRDSFRAVIREDVDTVVLILDDFVLAGVHDAILHSIDGNFELAQPEQTVFPVSIR